MSSLAPDHNLSDTARTKQRQLRSHDDKPWQPGTHFLIMLQAGLFFGTGRAAMPIERPLTIQ